MGVGSNHEWSKWRYTRDSSDSSAETDKDSSSDVKKRDSEICGLGKIIEENEKDGQQLHEIIEEHQAKGTEMQNKIIFLKELKNYKIRS